MEEVVNYTVEVLVPETRTYTINSDLDSWDIEPSSNDIKVYRNEEIISDFNTTILITNSNGDAIANITTIENETYTITYTITYEEVVVKEFSRTVTIE